MVSGGSGTVVFEREFGEEREIGGVFFGKGGSGRREVGAIR